MARKVRVEFAGAVYHVMDRGDRLEDIFFNDEDRLLFLKTLGETCGRAGWRVHSYVLMSNHYHLLLETPEANLVAGMSWFQSTVTIRHNARHRLRGHLFQGRYKAVLVDPETAGYFSTVSDYIHLNPVRAGMLQAGQLLREYPWSSYPAFSGPAKQRPRWLEGQRVLDACGSQDDAAGRRRYRLAMEERARVEMVGGALDEEALKSIRRGWCFGTEEFRHKILDLFEQKSQPSSADDGSFVRDHGIVAARRLVDRSLKSLGMNRQLLEKLPKNDPQKIAIATFVKCQTTVNNAWLADQLAMGAPSRVSRYCSEAKGRPEIEKIVINLSRSTD